MHRSTRSHSVLPILLVALAATLVASPVAGYSSPLSAAGPDARSQLAALFGKPIVPCSQSRT